MKRFIIWVKSLFFGLFLGLKKTEEKVLTSSGKDDDYIGGIQQQVREKSVAQALLRGELTQEVKELRHRVYKVDREAKKYEYYSPMLAVKRDENMLKEAKCDKSDGYKLITVQDNYLNKDTVLETLNNVKDEDIAKLSEDGEVSINIGKVKKNNNYAIKIERDFSPKFKIENFTKKIVVKEHEEKVFFGLYVSIYENDDIALSRQFLNATKRLKNGKKEDFVIFNSLEFITRHAYGLPDMIKFKFKNIKFIDIKEYDGNYIFNFECEYQTNAEDLTKEFFDEKMEKKYETKAKKELTYEFDLENVGRIKKYTCSKCGKDVYLSDKEIDAVAPTDGRDIFDKENNKKTISDGLDAEIMEQTFGTVLCKECFEKNKNEMYKKLFENGKF